jgi:CheY-like chemotaxis protein
MKSLPVYIDPDNFDKVILNILSNALKFTPGNGEVNIHLSMAKDENASATGSRKYFQIAIADTGIGIPEGELEKVFECFYQTRESKHTVREGTGIGLHLTRSIIELHQGFIRAENNINSPGCRFIIRLPLGKDHLKPEDILSVNDHASESQAIHHSNSLPSILPDVKVKAKNRHRVLVVDDDSGMREYLCVEMGTDYHMAKCADGREALSFILKHTPDLVISDIVMPEMDGITLCRKVKQNVNINHIPVVLLTARKEEQYNLEGLGIGADAYIVKPFNIELVRKTVQNIIRNREMLRNNYVGNQQQNDKIRDISIKSPDEKLLGKIMDTISENIPNPALNVEMLAHEIGISRVHLHRKLKELTNQSTRDLIRNIRLQQAGKLLAEKHFNISEVAFAVGFTNVAHFSNAFKEFYGVSPTVYMDRQRVV